MELLTIGVLGFQALIFVSMLIASKMGRQALNTCTGAWVLFTLLGSIATAGLMLLQLVTIIASYIYVLPAQKTATSAAPTKPQKSFSEKAGVAWDFIRIAVVLIFIAGWAIKQWVK